MPAAELIDEPSAALSVALGHAARLLTSNPTQAEAQALEILKVVPGHPEALLLLGASKRRNGDDVGANAVLAPLARSQPRAPIVHYEAGLTLASLGDGQGAIGALRHAVALKPDMTDAWRALGDQLILAGDGVGADRAYARQIQSSVGDPLLMQAAAALCDDQLGVAERLLRARLQERPTDVAAIRMLAETGTRLGRYADAEALLSRCLALAPSFTQARHNYAIVLYRQHKAADALPHIEALLTQSPEDPGYRNLKAAALGLVGDYGQSIAVYERVLADYPRQPKVWLSYGHALKTAGRQADAIAAYRRCLTQQPDLGEAFWSLANLKTFRFSPADLETMRAQLGRADLEEDDRLHLHYALGKALEDGQVYEASFVHYATGARLRRSQIGYDADGVTAQLNRSKALFTEDFFKTRAGFGFDDNAPIFIVGLPRSGSTLIEQILASHSMVEGTMELAEIIATARSIASDDRAYPDALATLDAKTLQALGEAFIERTQVHRKHARPFFIDKMPNNFLHIGLIQLILPNAKIIDARRDPMATCFSGFKQHFARGQNFSYDLTEIGRYYRDYVALMDHFDAVLPGRIHRVHYENMVADTEAEVRRLLNYCNLPFQSGCLKFYENDRAVRTASSEQVRQPIFREGLDQWRRYEPWLEELKTALSSPYSVSASPEPKAQGTE